MNRSQFGIFENEYLKANAIERIAFKEKYKTVLASQNLLERQTTISTLLEVVDKMKSKLSGNKKDIAA